ncbi:ABC transporter permease [Serratia proteamaculans]|uniref:ABC transporter permease n=1 Tax=Serratia proteamaculans TaxID=28151 RepID=UPI00217B92EA|nr:ABC transporter permease [Serratia proteamaculans]CAI1537661.1 Polysialic acid transport protein kpsM [Serratia proteamaculans]
MKDMLLAIYGYRGFIWSSIKRDFQSRYQTSMLGALWLVLQPLAMILVYTLVFSEVMKARMPNNAGPFAYSIYLCSGVLTWGLFTEILDKSQGVFISNANLIKKLSFPKICLPVIVTASAILNFAIIFSLFIVFLVVSGNFPGVLFLSVLPVLALQVLFAVGLGMTLGVMNVFFRDVGQFVGVLLQFWFWFTPIVYVLSSLPEWARKLLMYNPMARVMQSYQSIFAYHQQPNWYSLLPVLVLAIIFCTFGMRLFRKHAADMVDEL